MLKKLFWICFLFCGALPVCPPWRAAWGQINGQTVEYRDGDTVLEGYLAYDDALVSGKLPAVMVVHEWKGLNSDAKSRADQLAGLGYIGFAVDLYGKGVRPETHTEAGELSGMDRENRELLRGRAQAAYEFLIQQKHVDIKRIAAIGYCFGGTTVLEMARAALPLAGVASFHGDLSTSMPAELGDRPPAIRVFHGDEDKSTDGGLEGFRKEMREAAVEDWQVIILSGAVHRFAVPSAGNDKSTGMAYNERADKESWQALELFLKKIFV